MNLLNPPPQTIQRRPKRRWVPRLSEDPDKRSVQIGVTATILIHLLLLVVMPEKFENDLVGSFVPQQNSRNAQHFNIELAPDEFVDLKAAQQKPPPFKFVETNPDAPDNEPDKTNNFGAQNQQAAQEKPATKTGGDRPEMEGRKDMQSTQIVSGNLSDPKPMEATPPPPPEQPQAAQPTPQVRREQNPLPGTEKFEGDNKNAFGSNIAKIAPHPEAIPEKVEGSPDAPLVMGSPGLRPTVDRNRPRPRPVLDSRRARPAIFSENKIGTQNIGPLAVDARWSNYGQYLQKLIESVDAHWQKLVNEMRTYPPPGSIVTVKFILNSEGEIKRVVSVDAGMAGQQAEGVCVAGITRPAPFGKWTEDMIAVLGEEQEMTFAFYYN